MIPICQQQGCQIAKSGRKPCARNCVLQIPDRYDTAPSPKKPPKIKHEYLTNDPESEKEKKNPRVKGKLRVHYGTGIILTPKTLPQWRATPLCPEPWERAKCGVIYSSPLTTDIQQVTCESCLRGFHKKP